MPKPSPAAGTDVTEYARSLGYAGTKAVIVRDGLVTSHRNIEWSVFCSRCRAGRYSTAPQLPIAVSR
jgi:hypothetical protein